MKASVSPGAKPLITAVGMVVSSTCRVPPVPAKVRFVPLPRTPPSTASITPLPLIVVAMPVPPEAIKP